MANFIFEGNSDADAIWDAYRAETDQFVRLQIEGSQIGSGDNHSLIIDMSGKWEDVAPLDSEDRGNNLHRATLHNVYDGTGAQVLGLTVTTDVSAV